MTAGEGEIERYLFEDSEGNECSYSTFDVNEAHEVAAINHWRVIAHTYVWSDSEPVEELDFTDHDEEEEDICVCGSHRDQHTAKQIGSTGCFDPDDPDCDCTEFRSAKSDGGTAT